MRILILIIVVCVVLLGVYFLGRSRDSRLNRILWGGILALSVAYGAYFFYIGPVAVGQRYLNGLRDLEASSVRSSMCGALLDSPAYQTFFQQLDVVLSLGRNLGGAIQVDGWNYELDTGRFNYEISLASDLTGGRAGASGWLDIEPQIPFTFCVSQAQTFPAVSIR